MKNSNDTIGNRTRDLLACTTVPQPTAPPRVAILSAPFVHGASRFSRRSFICAGDVRKNAYRSSSSVLQNYVLLNCFEIRLVVVDLLLAYGRTDGPILIGSPREC